MRPNSVFTKRGIFSSGVCDHTCDPFRPGLFGSSGNFVQGRLEPEPLQLGASGLSASSDVGGQGRHPSRSSTKALSLARATVMYWAVRDKPASVGSVCKYRVLVLIRSLFWYCFDTLAASLFQLSHHVQGATRRAFANVQADHLQIIGEYTHSPDEREVNGPM